MEVEEEEALDDDLVAISARCPTRTYAKGELGRHVWIAMTRNRLEKLVDGRVVMNRNAWVDEEPVRIFFAIGKVAREVFGIGLVNLHHEIFDTHVLFVDETQVAVFVIERCIRVKGGHCHDLLFVSQEAKKKSIIK